MSGRAKKQSFKMFKIENLLWRYVLFLRVGGTSEEAHKWFNRKFKVKEPDAARSARGPSNAQTIILRDEKSHLIWFSERKPGAGVVAHEALHSVQHVLSVSGLGPLSDETEEAYAYLLGWTVREIGNRVW